MAKVRLSKGAKYVGNRYTSVFGIGAGTVIGTIGRTGSGEKLSLGTIGKSAIEAAAFEMLHPGLYWAQTAAGLIGTGLNSINTMNKKGALKYKQRVDTGLRSQYADTEQALTMRQAAVQAIQGNKMNARNALGGEAKMMHRSWHR